MTKTKDARARGEAMAGLSDRQAHSQRREDDEDRVVKYAATGKVLMMEGGQWKVLKQRWEVSYKSRRQTLRRS